MPIFYISLAIIQTILFEAHFLLYKTLVDIFGLHRSVLIILKVILTILSLSFVCGSLLARFFYNKFVKAIYMVVAIWFGFLVYFLLASALYWLTAISIGENQNASIAGIFFFAIALCTGIYGIMNANKIKIRYIRINITHLPSSWQKRKAVMLSDLHLGQMRGKTFAEKIATCIQNLSPDIVFFVGDVFDGVKTDVDECVSPLKHIKAPLGKFFVTGNHEEFSEDSARKYGNALRHIGVKVLENEKVIIDGVEIIGVTDSIATKKTTYLAALKKILEKEKMCPRILLKHTPVLTNLAEEVGIDLELSGHTHGGQVFPFNFITPLIFKNRNYGLSKQGAMQVYTSSGVGTWGPPMRIGSDPEIVVISFQDKSL